MPVELKDALEQINDIRGQLARVETFRGYRAASVAATGLVAVLTSLVQPRLVANAATGYRNYVLLWTAAAAVCLAGGGAQILYGYVKSHSRHQRATTRLVIAHLIPPIVAGAALAWSLGSRSADTAALLPGLWAILVAMGMFASRRHLPRTIGWVALYYLACGAAILEFLPGLGALEPWVMAATFGVGQLAAAMVLYWNLERNGSQEENC